MLKTGRRIRRQRKFSEDFKLKVVKEYETGKLSIGEMTKIYDIHAQVIYRWIYKYSKYNKQSIQVVEMKDSQAHKMKQMEARIKELEQAVGQKQMNIDYLEKMIDLAKDHYDIDIKKNSNTLHYGGSKNIKKD